MPKISACIISFNEEDKIEDCLKSLQTIADEIVVIDSNSTDQTCEIAAKYTDHVYTQDFLGHIEQKNFAISKASNDWILSLDCDERISPELEGSIFAQKDRLDAFGAYRFTRKTFYIYRWLNHCWYPDFKVRLFNRTLCKWGGTNPHDHVVTDATEVKTLTGDLEHYSFDSISDHIHTIDSFTDIAAQEIIDKGRRVNIFTPIIRAKATFIKLYILRLGILDGFAGLTVSVLSFMHVFVKYSKVIMRRRKP